MSDDATGWSEDFRRRVLRRSMDTGVVTPALFNGSRPSPQGRIAAVISEWWEKYRAVLPPDIFKELAAQAAARLGPEEREAVRVEVEAVCAALTDGIEFVDDEARRWSEIRATEQGLIRASDLLVASPDNLAAVRDVLRKIAAPSAGSGVKVLTPIDILAYAAQPVDWLVDGLLPAVGTSNFLAKPKVGKSALARQLCMAIGASGEDWLGRRVKRGLALYVALEGLTATNYHFKLMGLRVDDDVLVIADKLVTVKLLEDVIADKKPALVVVDTIFRLVRVKDSNSYSEVTAGYDDLIRIAGDYSCHVMAIHHAPKAERNVVDASLGSTAIAGAVDTQILVKKTSDDPRATRAVSSEQRVGQYIPWTILSWDPVREVVLGLGESVESAAVADVAAAILAKVTLLGTLERQTITKDKTLPGTTKDKDSALARLVELDKSLTRTKIGKKYLYALAEPPKLKRIK